MVALPIRAVDSSGQRQHPDLQLRAKKGDMPKLFEVTRDKKVVWEYFNPAVRAHEVHVVSTNGKPEGFLK